MGILGNISKGRKLLPNGGDAKRGDAAPPAAAGSSATPPRPRVGGAPGAPARTRPPGSPVAGGKDRTTSKRRRKGGPVSAKERIAGAAAPLHDRRRRLVGARETTLRDLGGLMLEMYKRNRFREELLLDKCEEVLAIEVEIAHVDQRLFQLAPPNAAGMRPIGRCECGAPIHPGQNFCGVCGRSFATLTQGRSCTRCGAGLRPSDHFCATCGTEAPDTLQTIEAAPRGSGASTIDAPSVAASAVAETVIIEAPPLDDAPAPPAATHAPAPPPVPPVPAEVPATPAPAAPVAPVAPVAPAPEVAIDAAIESQPGTLSESVAPFTGFPLTSTVPPPPIADPADPGTPSLQDVPPAPTPVVPAVPVAPDTHAAASAAQAAPTAPESKKEIAARNKRRAKEAKARAKLKAKAAREARKRGGGA